ncbi:amidase domain-containing protein [Ditylenchus destructor]|uniref:Amidase domain-containing protein n=1 Tax=Ditylenchus destructor TaxID=166010 RepID=A0AAD4N996_9BILA|nr:amidase domain-containing protein [Ditylenchus destructor]
MNWLKDYLCLALKLFARLYFIFINSIFEFVNLFRNRESVPPIPASREGELLLLSATRAAQLIRHGELTSNELVQAYINRIKEVNPLIMHDSYKQLASKQPLLGVPCTIKDNIKVKGYVTLAGNKKFLENQPNEEDAGIVKKLRDAGAIILATTNLPRLANGWEATNAVTGRTRNGTRTVHHMDSSSPGTVHHLGQFITWDNSSPGTIHHLDNSSPGTIHHP